MASRAFAFAPVLAVGVSLAAPAEAGTVNPVQATTYNLSTANNPITFGTGTNINVPGGTGVYGDTTAQWNVTNAGKIAGNRGIDLRDGGTVTNEAGGSITGTLTGLDIQGAPGTVTNAGTITGTTRNGVTFTAGGTLTNEATGTISAANDAVYVGGVGEQVTNAGSITGGNVGVGFGIDGTLANTGTITGGVYGATGSRGSVTITNTGAVTGGNRGVNLLAGGAVTNDAGGVIKGGLAGEYQTGVYITGGPGSVTNAGDIMGGSGVALRGGGTLDNTGNISGTAAAGFGAVVTGDAGTVTNSGNISAANFGVVLAAGGSVTNSAGGVITSNRDGVVIQGGSGTIDNGGTITDNNNTITGVAAILMDGGTITNEAGGVLNGATGAYGKAAFTLTNAGTITGRMFPGVSMFAGGTVDNQAGGEITGAATGLYAKGGAANVTNAGTITGTGFNGVALIAGGSLDNQATGKIVGGGNYGVYIEGGDALVTNAGSIAGVATGVGLNGTNSSVDNSGSIVSTGKYGFGVNIKAGGGTVTNETGGYISSTRTGVAINGGTGTVTNSGVIQSSERDGVFLGAGGEVTNNVGASITGAYYGVISIGDATVTNAGAITATATGTGNGVAIIGAGTLDNQAGGSITANAAVYAYGGALTLTNAGTINGVGTGRGANGVTALAGGSVQNAAGGVISGGAYGVYISGGDASVTNAGSITGAWAGVGLAGTNQSVDNSGSIKATGTYGVGVELIGTGAVTNEKGGYIGGTGVGVGITGDAPSVTNSGTIQGGYIGVGLLGAGGQVTNNAGATISGAYLGVGSVGAVTITNAGTISGANASAGYGVAVLNGATVANQAGGVINGFTGLNVSGGALTLTNAGTITGSGGVGVAAFYGATVTNQAGGAINGATVGLYVLGGATVTNAGKISGGVDSIVFAGPGANTLTLDTGSALVGDVLGSTDAAATNDLVLQGAGEADNSFVNFNTLTAKASGAWVLGGTSTIGTTEVDSGMLVIDGSLTTAAAVINGGNLQVGDAGHAGAQLISPVTVNVGGTLSGHGTVVGDVTNNGGTVAPGGSIGTLTITGDYTQSAAGTLAIQLTGAGSSRLDVTGTAHLAGTLVFTPISGVFRKGQVFDFLDAGTIDGSFSTITFNGPQIFTVSQHGNSLDATATVGNFALAGGTLNQRAIVPAFNNYPVGVSDFDPVANAIINLGPGAAQNLVVNELGSEISPDLLSASRDDVRSQLGGFTQQLATRPAAANGSNDSFWLQGAGRFGSVSSDGNAHGYSATTGGIAGGVQHDFGSATLGGAISYDQTWLSLKGLPQNGNVADTSFGAYGEERFGTMFADLGGIVGFDHGSVKRLIAAPGVSRQASGSFNGLSAGVVGLVGDRFAMSGGWTLEPHAGLEWNHVDQNGYTEAGAGGADLVVGSESQDAVQSLLGARISRAFSAGLTGDASLDWAHDFDDLTPRSAQSFAAVPGTGFTIAGVNPGRDAAVLHAGLNYRTSRITFYARYDGSFSGRADDNAVTGGFKIAF